MSETHCVVEVAGEVVPDGTEGVRVRARLSGRPSERWSQDFAARLATDLNGHAGVIERDDIIQCDEIVLEGVAGREAPALAARLSRAVDAANRSSASDDPCGATATVRADAAAATVAMALPTAVIVGRFEAGRCRSDGASRWFG